MRIEAFLHNLSSENSFLMPWRTVCEVIKSLKNEGNDAHVVSLGRKQGVLRGGFIPEETREIPKIPWLVRNQLKRRYQHQPPDVIFWPVSWRQGVIPVEIVADLGVPVVLWFPGGSYDLRTCIYALRRVGVRTTFPFLREAICRKGRQVTRFKRSGFESIITMTRVSANEMISAGWDNDRVYVIPPGRSEQIPDAGSLEIGEDFKKWLKGMPYFLYLGPPSRIRGVFELLAAFERVGHEEKRVKLVCLFRPDGSGDKTAIVRCMQGLSCRDRVLCTWNRLPMEMVYRYIGSCKAVLMPFVLVPSEIPLGIIESMGFGKPVIATEQGGTGPFVSQFGSTARVGDVSGLASAMIRLVRDSDYYKERCFLTSQAFENHPTWAEVASAWLKIGQIASQT